MEGSSVMRKPFAITFSSCHLFKNDSCDSILAFLSCKEFNQKPNLSNVLFSSSFLVLTDNASYTVLALVSDVSVTNVL